MNTTITRLLEVLLNEFNFFLRQAVEVVDQVINQAVGGGNLALEERLVVLRPRLGKLLAKCLVMMIRHSETWPLV